MEKLLSSSGLLGRKTEPCVMFGDTEESFNGYYFQCLEFKMTEITLRFTAYGEAFVVCLVIGG